MQSVALEPAFSLAHVAANRRTRDLEDLLERLRPHRFRGRDEEPEEDPAAAIGRVEDRRARCAGEVGQQLGACLRGALDPDPDSAPAREPEAVSLEHALDRGEVVADHPIGQLQLGSEVVHARRTDRLEESSRDPGLAGVERKRGRHQTSRANSALESSRPRVVRTIRSDASIDRSSAAIAQPKASARGGSSAAARGSPRSVRRPRIVASAAAVASSIGSWPPGGRWGAGPDAPFGASASTYRPRFAAFQRRVAPSNAWAPGPTASYGRRSQ